MQAQFSNPNSSLISKAEDRVLKFKILVKLASDSNSLFSLKKLNPNSSEFKILD